MVATLLKGRSLWIAAAMAAAAAGGYASSQPGVSQARTSPGAVSARAVGYARPTQPATAAARFPATFIGITPGATTRLAVYSSADGHRLKFLTTPQPGGGVSAPVLSARGRTVAFERGLGTCAGVIDTVPATGGRERVLIPMTGTGARTALPSRPSYSGDGRYLLYATSRCSEPPNQLLHRRNLRTGRELARPGSLTGLQGNAVFVNHNRQLAYAVFAGNLVVRQLPSFRMRTYPPPRNCRYQALAGTETKLAAVLQCGARHTLSLVAVSAHTFTITKTLIRLGSCLASTDLSLAAHDPAAMLVETTDACAPPQRAHARIVKIRGHTARPVRSGLAATMPHDVFW
jgi:hypothetical protein